MTITLTDRETSALKEVIGTYVSDITGLYLDDQAQRVSLLTEEKHAGLSHLVKIYQQIS